MLNLHLFFYMLTNFLALFCLESIYHPRISVFYNRLSLILGDLGEYCWSTKLRCTVGESLHRAYVVVPVDVSAVRHEMLEVRTTGPAVSTLQPHNSPSTIDDSCGLRYDVTQHFTAVNAGTSFCLHVITKDNVLGDDVLRCPPHLVTIWQKNQPSSAGGE